MYHMFLKAPLDSFHFSIYAASSSLRSLSCFSWSSRSRFLRCVLFPFSFCFFKLFLNGQTILILFVLLSFFVACHLFIFCTVQIFPRNWFRNAGKGLRLKCQRPCGRVPRARQQLYVCELKKSLYRRYTRSWQASTPALWISAKPSASRANIIHWRQYHSKSALKENDKGSCVRGIVVVPVAQKRLIPRPAQILSWLMFAIFQPE